MAAIKVGDTVVLKAHTIPYFKVIYLMDGEVIIARTLTTSGAMEIHRLPLAAVSLHALPKADSQAPEGYFDNW